MFRKQLLLVATAVFLFLLVSGTAVYAQQERGSIRGGVYADVNGDGRCVNTGIGGEVGVPNVDVEFVSSDGATVITLYTGDDGTFGLVEAGQSVWKVTAKPVGWTVTSQNPLYVPVMPDSGLIQTGVNFCISKGANAFIILPQSGAPAAHTSPLPIVLATAVFGLILIVSGAGLEVRRNRLGKQ